MSAIKYALFALLLSAPALTAGEDPAPSCDPGCHINAWCISTNQCECQPGTLDAAGSGLDCVENGHTVRYVLDDLLVPARRSVVIASWSDVNGWGLCKSPNTVGFYLRHLGSSTEVNCLYATEQQALDDRSWYVSQNDFPAAVAAGPGVYAWTLPSPRNPLPVPPTGLEVNGVAWNPQCGSSGCWVVRGLVTTGESISEVSTFNTFFLPHAVADGTPPGSVSYDTEYTQTGNHQGTSGQAAVEWTFSPAKHPCSSAGFDASGGNTQSVSTCCISNKGVGESGEGGPVAGVSGWTSGDKGGFTTNYRPLQSFVSWAQSLAGCTGGGGQVIDRPNYDEAAQGVTVDIDFPANHMEFISEDADNLGGGGKFFGLNDTKVSNLTLKDPFAGQYAYVIELDEVELRGSAGKLIGTIGVEHTVDTFLGLANFRPTGMVALDTFVTQQALHFEKTNFFTVSTTGVNAYTFLRYVNLRLVSVLVADPDFSGQIGPNTNDDEINNRTIRTNTDDNVNYLQVTFVVGDDYNVNNFPHDDIYTSGLIPLDSVRVGVGIFENDMVDVNGQQSSIMQSVCSVYQQAADSEDNTTVVGLPYGGKPVPKGQFDWTVAQSCGPNANMCSSPETVDDKFVSFNIPLGSEVLDGLASDTLSANVFVHLVINAIDETARDGGTDPNGGETPWQVKTTLSGSVPIVDGGVNIFCDALIAKTDLMDVAKADLLLGSTEGSNGGRRDELDDIRVHPNIGHSNLDGDTFDSVLESNSPEDGLLTLVIDGDDDFFDDALIIDDDPFRRGGRRNGNTGGFTLEIEDMYTIHLMEDGRAPPTDLPENDTSVAGTVQRLLAAPQDDNTDDFGLQTEGYSLNGAFDMVVERALGAARLQPSGDLLAVCPTTAVRPDPNALVLEVCITRREIQNRDPAVRPGSPPTSTEVARPPVAPSAATRSDVENYLDNAGDTSTEADFMASVLGDSSYARSLGVNFAKAISDTYGLNGRFKRAFWVNPAFEWTPTQTGSTQRFSLSQTIYLFALITLDEHIDRRSGATPRRMLMQSTNPLQDTSSGMTSVRVSSSATTRSMMATAYDVPKDRVGVFTVELQLAKEVACMDPAARQGAVRVLLDEYLADTASSFHTVQVLSLAVALNGEQCVARRRQLRAQGDLSAAVATVSMLVVFKQEDAPASFRTEAFEQLPGVLSVDPDSQNSAAIRVQPADGNVQVPGGSKQWGQDEEEGGGIGAGAMAGIIAGAVGAVVVALGVTGFVYMRKQNADSDVVVVEAANLEELKAALPERASADLSFDARKEAEVF